MQRQRAGDGHPLLLPAGQLVRIMVRPVAQAHLGQQVAGLLLQLGVDALFVGLVAGLLLRQQFARQHHVLQSGILREQVEVLEHQPKMQPLFADLALALGVGELGVPQRFAAHLDAAGVGGLQKIQTAQQRGFSAAGGPDDGDGLALFQLQRNILEHLGAVKAFADAAHFQ